MVLHLPRIPSTSRRTVDTDAALQCASDKLPSRELLERATFDKCGLLTSFPARSKHTSLLASSDKLACFSGLGVSLDLRGHSAYLQWTRVQVVRLALGLCNYGLFLSMCFRKSKLFSLSIVECDGEEPELNMMLINFGILLMEHDPYPKISLT